MDYSNLIQKIKSSPGKWGVIVKDVIFDQTLIAVNTEEWFPLASASKVAIGAAVVEMIIKNKTSWSEIVDNVSFDPKEDSHLEYPHLIGLKQLEVREVIEVMIGCHDNQCASSIASFLGGWDQLQIQIQSRYPTIHICHNPFDLVNNGGTLSDLSLLIQDVVKGYRWNPFLWMPIISGLARQKYKATGIPTHKLFNMTGGLSTLLVDVGIIGDMYSERVFTYAIAGENLPDRAENPSVDRTVDYILSELYKELIPS